MDSKFRVSFTITITGSLTEGGADVEDAKQKAFALLQKQVGDSQVFTQNGEDMLDDLDIKIDECTEIIQTQDTLTILIERDGKCYLRKVSRDYLKTLVGQYVQYSEQEMFSNYPNKYSTLLDSVLDQPPLSELDKGTVDLHLSYDGSMNHAGYEIDWDTLKQVDNLRL